MNYFRFSGAILNFVVKESPDKVSMGTVEKFTLENMGIAFGILSLGGTKAEIHHGGHLSPPNCSVLFKKNTIATLGLTRPRRKHVYRRDLGYLSTLFPVTI